MSAGLDAPCMRKALDFWDAGMMNNSDPIYNLVRNADENYGSQFIIYDR